MSRVSAIEWTDATWNPVTGCTQVSPGCDHCYALTFAERFRGVPGHPYEQGFDLKLWPERLELPLRWKRPRRIFVNSMSDLFHQGVPDDYVRQVFDVMVRADWHIFQVLTKRSGRLARLGQTLPWRPHIWAGVSVESNRYVWRADQLRTVPAHVRFISAEPLLGPLDRLSLEGIHWLISGGESGPGHRPCDPEWVRDLRDRCVAAGVAFFHKQWGGRTPKAGGRLLDGRTWDDLPTVPATPADVRLGPPHKTQQLEPGLAMAKHFDSIWPLEPHTRAKHEILRYYLDAWLPIMASWNGRVLYIDGFAGPGRYRDGEPGSPIVALTAALDHRYPIRAELVYLFIEADEQRKANLEQEIAKLTLPANIKCHVHLGKFDETVTQVLDELDDGGLRIAPTFAFVDPFGWSQTPFALIKRLLAKPSCEVLINFMYEEVNRFIGVPDHAHHFDRLFGTGEWREMTSVQGAAERRRWIHDLYERQLLRDTGARFVRSFEMRNQRNRTDYYLFFATKDRQGLAKMKEAMWRVDPGGAFRFSDVSAPSQPVLFQPQPDFAQLRRQIVDRFRGKIVPVEDIESYVIEETAFLSTHYKRRVLAEMEKESPPALEVVSAPPGRKRGTFPEGTRIHIL